MTAIEAILPSGMTLQDLAVLLAGGVCQAYTAYNNASNNTTSFPAYRSINEVYVYEAAPNLDPFAVAGAAVQARSALARADNVRRIPPAYAGVGGEPSNACSTANPGTPSKGNQPFGFTAASNDNSHNILVLRGTVTMEEAGYDMIG